jgi:repressor LexA
MKMSEMVKKRLCFICGEKYKINRGLSNYIGSELNTCDTCGSNCNDLNDIAKALNLRANSTIHQHLESLEKKGLIKRGRFNNTIEIVEKDFDFSDVKDVHLLGYIAAGKPLEAIEDKTNIIRISKDMYGSKDIFALKVKGDSMIDAHIMDGDTIIVESKTTADEGQIVVALLEDYSATLKVYSRDKKNKKFVLKPMNPKYEPIVTDKLYIQGILLGVIRGY